MKSRTIEERIGFMVGVGVVGLLCIGAGAAIFFLPEVKNPPPKSSDDVEIMIKADGSPAVGVGVGDGVAIDPATGEIGVAF